MIINTIRFQEILEDKFPDIPRSKRAEKLGIDDTTLDTWITGKHNPTFRKLAPICRKLGISVEDILLHNPRQYSETADDILEDFAGIRKYYNDLMGTESYNVDAHSEELRKQFQVVCALIEKTDPPTEDEFYNTEDELDDNGLPKVK